MPAEIFASQMFLASASRHTWQAGTLQGQRGKGNKQGYVPVVAMLLLFTGLVVVCHSHLIGALALYDPTPSIVRQRQTLLQSVSRDDSPCFVHILVLRSDGSIGGVQRYRRREARTARSRNGMRPERNMVTMCLVDSVFIFVSSFIDNSCLVVSA